MNSNLPRFRARLLLAGAAFIAVAAVAASAIGLRTSRAEPAPPTLWLRDELAWAVSLPNRALVLEHQDGRRRQGLALEDVSHWPALEAPERVIDALLAGEVPPGAQCGSAAA